MQALARQPGSRYEALVSMPYISYSDLQVFAYGFIVCAATVRRHIAHPRRPSLYKASPIAKVAAGPNDNAEAPRRA